MEFEDQKVLEDEDFILFKQNYEKQMIKTIKERSENYSQDEFDEYSNDIKA